MAITLAGSNANDAFADGNVPSIVTAYPFTMFVLARSRALTTLQSAFTFEQATTPNNGFHLYFTAGTKLALQCPNSAAVTAASFTSNQWYAFAGRATSSTSADVLMDGASTAITNVGTFYSSPSPSRIRMGARDDGAGVKSLLNGDMCFGALWNVALTDAEIASLVKGFPPRRVRPQSLQWYAPLVREPGIRRMNKSASPGYFGPALGSPTIANHPRTYGF